MRRPPARRSRPTLLAFEDRSTPALFTVGSSFPARGTDAGGEYALNDLIAADLTNDGAADAVAVNSRTGTFQVFRNTGSGQFTPGPALSSTAAAGLPTTAVAADFTGDGKLDLVTTYLDQTPGGSAGDAVVVWLGNGDGTFTAAPAGPGGVLRLEGWDAAAADFNADGKRDLALVCPDGVTGFGLGGYAVLLGNGDGTFAPVADAAATQFAANTAAFAADFDADGKIDFASADSPSGGGAQVVFGAGNGAADQVVTLSAPAGLAIGGKVVSAASADFTGDGKPDLLVGYQNGELYLFANQGARQFSAPALKFIGSGTAFDLAAGDFNGDGRADVALAELDAALVGGQAVVLLNDGTGTFAPAVGSPFPTDGGPYKAAAADFTGDHTPDVLVGNFGTDTLQLLSNTTPRPTAVALAASPANVNAGQPVTLTATETTTTGTPATPTGTVTFRNGATVLGTAGVGAGGLAVLTTSSLTVGANAVVAQFDSTTGFQSSVSAPATVQVNPVLGLASQFAAGTDRGGGAAALFNPDGGIRYTVAPFAEFTGGIRVAAADFTGDGVADLVVGSGPGMATLVRVLDGVDQSELFAVQPFEASFTGGVCVAAGDLNGDGTPDLVITPDEGGGPRVRVFSGKGFSQLADFLGIEDPNFRGGARSAVGDLNGDGAGDLIVAAGFGGGPRVAAFDGRSLAGGPVKLFADVLAFEPALRNGTFVTAGDLDGDGFAELVAGGGPGGGPRVTAFAGQALLGNRQNVLLDFFTGDVTNRNGVRLAAKDLDDDGKADLVTGPGAGAGGLVSAYLGKNLTPTGGSAALNFQPFAGFQGGVFVG